MIGLIDVDNKLPNLALMKISTYFKNLGAPVEFVRQGQEYEKIYASAIFSRSKKLCDSLIEQYGDKIEIGGTGWDIAKTLPAGVNSCRADYSLYNAEIIADRIRIIGTKQRRLQKATEIVNAGFERLCSALPLLLSSIQRGRVAARTRNPRYNKSAVKRNYTS